MYIFFLTSSCVSSSTDSLDTPVANESVKKATYLQNDTTILLRITPPENYERTIEAATSYQHYLRTLPLKPRGSVVKYFDGRTKPNNGVYEEVVDLEIGNRDLHQCADAVMRLKAEYLWINGKYDEIHFNFTSGFRVDYGEWMKGRRVVVTGNEAKWNNRNKPSNTYEDFWKYMELIFSYAGTASLEKELAHVEEAEAQIGDVLIQGGFPGHAVLIVDKAKNIETGNTVFLLAQSYMPAQELQILKNPSNDSLGPWYEIKGGQIETPEWIFYRKDLKRFRD